MNRQLCLVINRNSFNMMSISISMGVIGIAGPSCSRKSTVARMLAEDLDTNTFILDEF